jgi:agmatinase
MQNKNNLTFIGCDCEFNDADLIIFGAPYDCTASNRAGSRFAPKAIRTDSYGLETYSPYQNKEICDYKIADFGDLELSFGDPAPVLNQISEFVKKIISVNKLPFMIGGEHLVTLGAIRELSIKYPDLHILHFDAHTDLREDYLGQKLSHATVIKRCWDIIGDNKIFQFGIRSGEKEEFDWAEKHTYLHKFDLNTLDEIIEKLNGKPVYFTLDLDILDPSIFSGTGTPEAGGISFTELLKAILKLKKLDIVGTDVNELCPPCDLSGVSTAVACKIIRELLIAISK